MIQRHTFAIALTFCITYYVFALQYTDGLPLLSPDGVHNALVARSFARGEGLTLQMIQYHPGRFESVRHVAEMHGLLQPVLLGILFFLSGESESMIVVLSFAYVALTAMVAFLFCRRLFGAVSGLLACLLVLCSPGLFEWAWMGVDDAGFSLFYLSTIVFFTFGVLENKRIYFVLCGIMGSIALLQKSTAVILLPLLIIGVLWFDRSKKNRRLDETVYRTGWVTLPLFFSFSAYLVRNYFDHGGLSFRVGTMDWIYRSQGWVAFHGYYDSTPKLGEIIQTIGFKRLVEVIFEQLSQFFAMLSPLEDLGQHAVLAMDSLGVPAFVMPLGFLALLYHFYRCPQFALPSMLTVLGSALFVCGFWHVEVRYFSMLVPLLSISFSGALFQIAQIQGNGRTRITPRLMAFGFGLSTLLISIFLFSRILSGADDGLKKPYDERPCFDVEQYIRQNTCTYDRILTLDPWGVTWFTERPAIMIPSGGESAILSVARLYAPKWVVIHKEHLFVEALVSMRDLVEKKSSDFVASPAFRGKDCDIYRIDYPTPFRSNATHCSEGN